MPRRSIAAAIATGLVTAAVIASAAVAANPVKGATYKGTWGTKLNGGSVQLKVLGSGRQVSNFKLSPVPLHCQGVIPSMGSASVAVSKQGTFTARLALYFPPTLPSRHVGTLTVSGTFLSHGRERGQLVAKYGSHGFSKSCGETVKYSTKG
jgi:hypothetical protein